jgi:hypothetical protein
LKPELNYRTSCSLNFAALAAETVESRCLSTASIG